MAPGGFAASCHTSRFALQHLGPAAGHRLLRSHLCLAVAWKISGRPSFIKLPRVTQKDRGEIERADTRGGTQ
jgi:hypothetical protein